MRELASDAYIVAIVPIDSLRCTLDRIGSLSSISVSIIEVEQHFLVVPRPPLVFLLIEYFLLSFDSANYLLGIDSLAPVSEKAHSEFASPGHDAISSACYYDNETVVGSGDEVSNIDTLDPFGYLNGRYDVHYDYFFLFCHPNNNIKGAIPRSHSHVRSLHPYGKEGIIVIDILAYCSMQAPPS